MPPGDAAEPPAAGAAAVPGALGEEAPLTGAPSIAPHGARVDLLGTLSTMAAVTEARR